MVRQVWDIRSYGKLLRRRSRVYLMFRNWRVFMTGIGLFLLAISAVAWGAWVHRAWRARMLADADTVDATVLAKDVETLEITDTWHGNGGIEQSFFLTYRFTDPAGRTVTTRREVSRSDWDPVHEGGPIPVRYARADAEVNEPIARYPGPALGVQVIGPGIVTAIGLGLLTASWRRAGRDARILAHGKLVEGTVLEQVPPTDDELGRIRFRYQPDCAPPCEATEEVTGEYDPLSKLGAGDPVTVIYDPAEPAAGRALRPYLAAMLR